MITMMIMTGLYLTGFIYLSDDLNAIWNWQKNSKSIQTLDSVISILGSRINP